MKVEIEGITIHNFNGLYFVENRAGEGVSVSGRQMADAVEILFNNLT